MRVNAVFGVVVFLVAGATAAWAGDDPLTKGDIVEFEPQPGRDVVKPMKPDWCSANKATQRDYDKHKAARISESLKMERKLTEATLIEIAQASCAHADNAVWQEQVAHWRQQLVNLTGMSEADNRASLRVRVSPEARDKLIQEACKKVPETNAESAPEEIAIAQAHRMILGCDYSGSAGPSSVFEIERLDGDQLGWWLDRRPDIESQVLKAFFVARAVGDWSALPDATKPEIMAGFILSAQDGKTLDRKKLAAELKDIAWNDWGKVRARELVGFAEFLTNHLDAKYRKMGEKDPDIKQVLIDAPKDAFAAWTKHYNDNKAAYEAVWAFEQKLYAPSKKAVAGCEVDLHNRLRDYVAPAKLTAVQILQSVPTDLLGHLLASALLDCYQRQDQFYMTQVFSNLLRTGSQTYRGPRLLAYYRAVWYADKIAKDRPSFPAASLPMPYRIVRSHIGQNPNTDEISGEVTKVTKRDDGVLIEFKPVMVEEDVRNCKNTKEVEKVWEDGRIQYRQECKTVRTEKRKVPVRALLAPGGMGLEKTIKPGQFVFHRGENSQAMPADQPRRGFPVEVYADKDLKKPVLFYGFPVDKTK